MKNILILGVGGEGVTNLFNHENTGAITITDDEYNRIMHVLERTITEDSLPPLTGDVFNRIRHVPTPDSVIVVDSLPAVCEYSNVYFDEDSVRIGPISGIEREITLERIIKRSKNPIEILNARRELNDLKFNHRKRKK